MPTKELRELALQMINKSSKEIQNGIEWSIEELEYSFWTQIFESTAGPNEGLGGCAMTEFQVSAFTSPIGTTALHCAGVWKIYESGTGGNKVENQRW